MVGRAFMPLREYGEPAADLKTLMASLTHPEGAHRKEFRQAPDLSYMDEIDVNEDGVPIVEGMKLFDGDVEYLPIEVRS